MTPKGNSIAGVEECAAWALFERGESAAALEAVSGWEPGVFRDLVEGCALAASEPETAKDKIGRAINSLPDGELREKAKNWQACAYWAAGEQKEARILLEAVSPISQDLVFLKHLNLSIFETADLNVSLAFLSKIESLVDEVFPLWRGKFFNQRGWLKRRFNDTDGAILDYEAAAFWFEQAQASRFHAAVGNNLAGLLSSAGRFSEARAAVDQATRSLRTSDCLYRAQMLDQKAEIYLAESLDAEALDCAKESVDLLSTLEAKKLLVKSQITLSRALAHLKQFVAAFGELDQAQSTSEFLGDRELQLEVMKVRQEIIPQFELRSHVAMVELALKLSDGKLRKAARLLGCAYQPLDRYIKLHKIKWHPKVTKSIITKSQK